MYQNLQQLKTLSYEELSVHKKNADETKAELEALKAKGGKAWTQELQEKLNEVTLFLVDLEEVLEEKRLYKLKNPNRRGLMPHRKVLKRWGLMSHRKVLKRWCICLLYRAEDSILCRVRRSLLLIFRCSHSLNGNFSRSTS